MSMTPIEIVHRMRRLRLGPPFAGFCRLEAKVDAQEFNKSKDWMDNFPCYVKLKWKHGTEVRAITQRFKVSTLVVTPEGLDAFLRTQVRRLLTQVAKMAEVTIE
jgi:hypothetical protein